MLLVTHSDKHHFLLKTVGSREIVKPDLPGGSAQSGRAALRLHVSYESMPGIRQAGWRYETTSENDNNYII
jgi:hypothetical protein